MGILDRWLKPKIDPEIQAYGQALAAQQSSQSDTDVEFDKLLGINKVLINDDFLNQHKEVRCFDFVPVKEKSGKYKVDEQNNIVFTRKPNWGELAIRELYTHLQSVRFRTPKEAELAKIEAEILLTKLQMAEPETSDYLQRSAYLSAIGLNIRGAFDDSINGRKAKLLKVLMKATSVEVTQPKERTEKGWL